MNSTSLQLTSNLSLLSLIPGGRDGSGESMTINSGLQCVVNSYWFEGCTGQHFMRWKFGSGCLWHGMGA